MLTFFSSGKKSVQKEMTIHILTLPVIWFITKKHSFRYFKVVRCSKHLSFCSFFSLFVIESTTEQILYIKKLDLSSSETIVTQKKYHLQTEYLYSVI